jgi:putative transposase
MNELIRLRLHEIAQEEPMVGYRTAWACLRREGRVVNHKRVQRLWREEGLTQPRRKKRVRHQGNGVPMSATHRNQVWTYDFLHDRTEQGQLLRILTIEDEFTREGLAVVVDRELPASRVKEVLMALFAKHGLPEHLRSDNGPEFLAKELTTWLAEQGVRTHYIAPGSPWQNAYGESFNGTLRRERLDREVYHTVAEASVRVESWRRHYNERRPHSSLGYLTPEEFKDGVRIPLLERGRPSTHASRKRAIRKQSLYL